MQCFNFSQPGESDPVQRSSLQQITITIDLSPVLIHMQTQRQDQTGYQVHSVRICLIPELIFMLTQKKTKQNCTRCLFLRGEKDGVEFTVKECLASIFSLDTTQMFKKCFKMGSLPGNVITFSAENLLMIQINSDSDLN